MFPTIVDVGGRCDLQGAEFDGLSGFFKRFPQPETPIPEEKAGVAQLPSANIQRAFLAKSLPFAVHPGMIRVSFFFGQPLAAYRAGHSFCRFESGSLWFFAALQARFIRV